MAIEAPVHRERRYGVDLPHQVDPAMALDAADAVADVRRVVEVNELRELMNPLPTQWFVLEIARADGRQTFRSLPTCEWQFMHTDVGGAPA